MATKKLPKLAQRETNANGYVVSIGLTADIGYVSIQDNNLYPDDHSGSKRRELNFNTMMIPCMTRQDLKDLHIAIGEVLKNSK